VIGAVRWAKALETVDTRKAIAISSFILIK
jgi:hypothetical protein